MIDYDLIKKSNIIKIFSHRIADIMICESKEGTRNLKNIDYIPGRNREGREVIQKIYLFQNSPEMFEIFEKYTRKPEKVTTKQKESEGV